MDIQAISQLNNNCVYRHSAAPKESVPNCAQKDVVQSNYLHFTGWFRRNKDKTDPFDGNKYGLSGNDYTLSFKVADILHRLDNENILLLGNPTSIWPKGFMQTMYTKEGSYLKNQKDIKNVYMINVDTPNPLIIQKTGKNEFNIVGLARNLTHPKDTVLFHSKDFWYDNTAQIGDVLELKDGLKVKLINLPKESNVIMYDAKFPLDSFLTAGPCLEGGFVINKFSDVCNVLSDKSGVDASESKYGQPIPHRTFDDIAGMDDAVHYMKEKLLYPILYPNAFQDEKNHGLILYGPPGTGKTLLALATIGEVKKRQDTDVYFVKINSRDLEQKYVGVSEKMWREVFEELEENQPSVLFIDEIDALLCDRDKTKDSSHNSATSQVSQLLQSIDNLEKTNARVWVIGATNRIDSIDPAIKRSGRLGDSIEVKRPDEDGCKAILELYLKGKNVSDNFDRDGFAKECHKLEYTGSDIAQIVNETKLKMYKRTGIIDKMEDGTYNDKDLVGIQYTSDDFNEALKTQQINKEVRRKVGF